MKIDINQNILSRMNLSGKNSPEMIREVLDVLIRHFPEQYLVLTINLEAHYQRVKELSLEYYKQIPASMGESYLLQRAYVLGITAVLHEKGFIQPFSVRFPFIDMHTSSYSKDNLKSSEEPPPVP